MLNMFGFKIFINIPFLMELRTLMDWVWTDTSMTLFDWLKMEDIFANVYQLKCGRSMEDDLPAPRGQKKGPVVKYLMGGGMILGIIAVIWVSAVNIHQPGNWTRCILDFLSVPTRAIRILQHSR